MSEFSQIHQSTRVLTCVCAYGCAYAGAHEFVYLCVHLHLYIYILVFNFLVGSIFSIFVDKLLGCLNIYILNPLCCDIYGEGNMSNVLTLSKLSQIL